MSKGAKKNKKPKVTARARPWLEKEGLTLITGWARDGLSERQISHNMGIAYSTFNEWKKKYSELSEALKKGKEVSDYEVENALYKSAMSGNVTAQIFWLKNRKPSNWRDRVEYSESEDYEVVEIVNDIE